MSGMRMMTDDFQFWSSTIAKLYPTLSFCDFKLRMTAAAKRSQRLVQREQPRAQALQAERQRRAGVRHAALFTERQRAWASEAAAIAARAAVRL